MLGPQVVHETIDGETVVINLDTGTYYSIEDSGADLWDRLVRDEPPEQSARDLAAQHGGDVDAVLAVVLRFHAELAAEGLVLLADGVAGDSTVEGTLGTFVAPSLQAYADLREHLLLDPVHDVETSSGWPTVSAHG